MEDIEDYSGHAESVLSGLRDAVGNADEQLLKLQRELDLLERKAQERSDCFQYVEKHKQQSEASDIDDEDFSKYLDESSQKTIDDSILDSLRSSASHVGDRSSTNFHETRISYSPTTLSPKSSTPVMRPAPAMRKSKTPSDETSMTSNMRTVAGSEKEDVALEERWGCLKRVLSEDRSGNSAARNELFKQILHATEKKHRYPAKRKADSSNQNLDAKLQMSTVAGPKNKSPFESFQAVRDPVEEKKDDGRPERREKNRFLTDNEVDKTPSRYFKPIREDPVPPESVGDDNSKVLEEARAENQRLQSLLEEEKKKSDKLTDKVSTLEKDVEELHVAAELKNHEAVTGKISGIIEEIQMAQKVRERAMMERLHIAARDRDDALMRAKAIHLKIIQSQKPALKDKGDKTLMDLVEKIGMADSARIIEKYGNELVERMNNLKNARARITAEEMAAVITERDDAVAKCHTLRQELQNCIEELNSLKRSQHTSVNTTLKEKVLSTREECEQTKARLHNAEEEIEMLRTYYSLHKSLTLAQDEDLNKKYNEYVEKIRDEAVTRAEQAKQIEVENFQLREKLTAAAQEIRDAHSENARIQHDVHHLKEKCGKLERLVKVLRKKLVAQAHGPSPGPMAAKAES